MPQTLTMPTLARFEPGTYIELNDVFTGTRKLARVSDTGQAYQDLDDEGATAFPIYQELKPAEAGNILGWGLYLVDHHPQEHAAFHALVQRLIDSGADVLTYNRAAHWAFTHHHYDFDAALAAACQATALIQQARNRMDTSITTAQAFELGYLT